MPPSACSSKPNLAERRDGARRQRRQRAAAGRRATTTSTSEQNFPLLFAAQLELVTQAMICNAAPIIGLMPMYATCDFDFGFAGAPGSHHNGLSHTRYQAARRAAASTTRRIDIANLQAAARAPFATAQKWFMTQLVNKVVSVLATTDDPAAPGTKVLDNTPHLRDERDRRRAGPHAGQRDPLPADARQPPALTIGKCGGAIKSGQVVQFPIAEKATAATVNRPAADLYLTMAQAMGAANVTFPGQTGRPPRGARVTAAWLASLGAVWRCGAVRWAPASRPAGCAGTAGGTGTGGQHRHRRRPPGQRAPAGTAGTAGSTSTGSAGTRQPELQLDCSGPSPGGPFLRLLTRYRAAEHADGHLPRGEGAVDARRCRRATISAHGFDNDGSAQVGAQLAGAVRRHRALARDGAGRDAARRRSCPARPAPADHACAETFLNKYGRRLFRRPITTAEHDRATCRSSTRRRRSPTSRPRSSG